MECAAVPHLSAQPNYKLKLFVTTYAASSHRAMRNLSNILENQLKGHYELEVIDVRQQPQMVLQENITALPLLVKMLPLPSKRMIGDMSDRVKVLAGLNLPAR